MYPLSLLVKMEISIFISHRHTDRQIAEAINKNLQLWGIPQKSIYQSSAAGGAGPRIGGTLTEDLKDALYRANAVLLVYTFADQDWSYCMWECGVATDPKSQSTKIVVFKTTDDIPKVFQDTILIGITERDILRFTTQFHKEVGFLSDESPAFAPDIGEEILKRRSNDLYNDLSRVIPQGRRKERKDRYRWDCFTLKLNPDSVERIKNQKQSIDNQINIIQQESEVTNQVFGDALKHFGFDEFESELNFNNLVERWKTTISYIEDTPQAWIKELCIEMLRAVENKSAEPTWELMKSARRYLDWWFYPVVNHVRINPDDSMEFQIYMYRVPGSLPNNPI